MGKFDWGSAGEGAVEGGTAGAQYGGPWGAVIGALIGATTKGFSGNKNRDGGGNAKGDIWNTALRMAPKTFGASSGGNVGVPSSVETLPPSVLKRQNDLNGLDGDVAGPEGLDLFKQVLDMYGQSGAEESGGGAPEVPQEKIMPTQKAAINMAPLLGFPSLTKSSVSELLRQASLARMGR